MTASTVDQPLDAVVVGGGIAGLAAARSLSGRRYQLLESEPQAGGRARSVQLGDHQFNTAAQVITGSTGATSVLADELGVKTTRIPKSKLSIHMSGTYVTASTEPGFLLRLPVSMRDRARLASAILSMRFRYRGTIVMSAPKVRRVEAMTVSELVGANRSPSLQALWDVLSLSVTTARAEEASALVAIRTIPTLQSREEYAIVGGTGMLTQALIDRSGGHIRLGATVRSVRDLGDVVCVRYQSDGHDHEVWARHCILAVPSPIVLEVVEELPDWKRDALADTDFRPLTTAAFHHRGSTTDILGEGVWRIPVVGSRIVGVVNPTLANVDPRDHKADGMVRVQTDDVASAALSGLPDTEVADILWEDLVRLFPALSGRLLASSVMHWRYGVSPWRPGHLARLPALGASTGRLHYCGDYLDEQGMAGSIVSAQAASDEVVRLLEAEESGG